MTQQRDVAAGGVHEYTASSAWDRYGWVMAVVWLVFLIYPLMGLIHSPAASGWVAAGWVGLVGFVVIYVTGFLNGMNGNGGGLTEPVHPVQWWAFAGLIATALVTLPAVGGNALSFVPFISSFASYGLTRKAHWITLITAVVVTTASVLMIDGWLEFFPLIVVMLLMGTVNTVSTELIIRSAATEQLGLELATSRGREAVARDVHDLVGHSLTVVRMKAQLALRLIDSDPGRAKSELADIEQLTAEAISGVRETVAGVRGAILADELVSCRDALTAAGITVSVDGQPDTLSPAQALTAGWVLREATTNVLRHAHARHVSIAVAPGTFTVTDDGVGFSPDAGFRGREGNGVRGMRERATMAGATLQLRAPASGGTTVEVTW
ncbi:sensor histidine kinase [Microbacterium sp. YY-01]|uniref:sensor histidine kinase n=1 Tax=Microbacterium sp. YY-01 TaxID=3421634 RepID=UPI003D178613